MKPAPPTMHASMIWALEWRLVSASFPALHMARQRMAASAARAPRRGSNSTAEFSKLGRELPGRSLLLGNDVLLPEHVQSAGGEVEACGGDHTQRGCQLGHRPAQQVDRYEVVDQSAERACGDETSELSQERPVASIREAEA